MRFGLATFSLTRENRGICNFSQSRPSDVRREERPLLLVLTRARFANVSLAGAAFDDIDFSGTAITANCNFRGMTIAGVAVADPFAAYEWQQKQT